MSGDKFFHFILAGLVVFLFWGETARARRLLKISTIGIVSPHLDKSLTPQQKTDAMIEHLRGQVNQVLPDQPDLIVLPEVCDRPAGLTKTEQDDYYKVRGNQVSDFLAATAKENHCYIAFGTKRLDHNSDWRNSCILLDRSGNIAGIYDKNFPTVPEMEGGVVAGNETPIIHTDFGTVGCAICFDLNFDELRERYAALKPDIILFVSLYHGGLVQANWAYSCESWFVGAVGIAQLPSEIRNPMGQVVATTTNYFNFVTTSVNLDYKLAHLDFNWGKLHALKKKYGPEVTIYDPAEIGCVMITSESDSISAEEMVQEFEIEMLHDYFDRSRAFRRQPGMMK
jgi:hypothetical protein